MQFFFNFERVLLATRGARATSKPGMRSRDIFGRLRLQLRLQGSISAPAPAPAPSKTVLRLRLRLRAKCTGSGGSGSDDQVLIWVLTSITIFKNAKCQNMTSYWLGSEFECYFFSVFENCHSSSKATGWHWRGHKLLRVALSEISGLGPKWSFANDTQRILNIRKRISARWRFWSVAWPNLIKEFLDFWIIKMHVAGSEENLKYFIAFVLKLLMKNIYNLFFGYLLFRC